MTDVLFVSVPSNQATWAVRRRGCSPGWGGSRRSPAPQELSGKTSGLALAAKFELPDLKVRARAPRAARGRPD